jgi:hypothetical protein
VRTREPLACGNWGDGARSDTLRAGSASRPPQSPCAATGAQDESEPILGPLGRLTALPGGSPSPHPPLPEVSGSGAGRSSTSTETSDPGSGSGAGRSSTSTETSDPGSGSGAGRSSTSTETADPGSGSETGCQQTGHRAQAPGPMVPQEAPQAAQEARAGSEAPPAPPAGSPAEASSGAPGRGSPASPGVPGAGAFCRPSSARASSRNEDRSEAVPPSGGGASGWASRPIVTAPPWRLSQVQPEVSPYGLKDQPPPRQLARVIRSKQGYRRTSTPFSECLRPREAYSNTIP